MTALTTAGQAAGAFRHLRLNLLRNQLRVLLRTSRLRLFMIAVCSAIFWAGLFGLFFEGFQFLGSSEDPRQCVRFRPAGAAV